ncbi:hypothetical protein C8Q70DRAFT_1058720 [Cubamyces menziesii]|nr:hypothetical protein C8Q70DRAFT_1058720 [Cubamyces menziesii]
MPFEYRPKTRRFEVPLPADTDHTFKINIISSGEVGYKLTTSDFPLYDRELQQIDSIETTVAGRVDNAAISLDSMIQGGFYVQRVHFARETTLMNPTGIFPRPRDYRDREFTLGHLISMLQTMQSEHWFRKVKCNNNLRFVTGTDGILPQQHRHTMVEVRIPS